MTKNKISDLENELIKEATTIVKNDEKVLTLPFLQQAYDVYFNSFKKIPKILILELQGFIWVFIWQAGVCLEIQHF